MIETTAPMIAPPFLLSSVLCGCGFLPYRGSHLSCHCLTRHKCDPEVWEFATHDLAGVGVAACIIQYKSHLPNVVEGYFEGFYAWRDIMHGFSRLILPQRRPLPSQFFFPRWFLMSCCFFEFLSGR